MALFTEPQRATYAQASMPQPTFAHGPWGEAIRHWLQKKNMSPADLARATGIQANTISRARRGFHTTTRVLEKIALAFKEPIEDVLVSPERRSALEDRKRIIQEAVEAALRAADPKGAAASASVADTAFEAVERHTQRLESLDAAVRQTPTRSRGKIPKTVPGKKKR